MAISPKPPPAHVTFLSGLPDRLFHWTAERCHTRNLAAEEMLFLAGDPGDGFYQVEEGLLKVSIVSATGTERILAIVGPGSIVGDLAIIDGKPRSASVRARCATPGCSSSA